MKMNKKQYNNIIDHTLKHEHTEDSLSTARAIFNNMGVALPNGDMKEVYDTIKTDNYMGWRSCSMQEAQEASDNGTAAIGISEDRIVVLTATDEEEPVEQTAEVMTITDNTPAVAVAGLQYYSYGSGSTTNYNNLYFANSSLSVKVGWTGYNALYGSSASTIYWYSSNTDVITVGSLSGYMQAIGTGSAWVTATTDNGYSADFYVEVEKLTKYVTVEETVRDIAMIGNELGTGSVISYQQYDVLVRLFYNITRLKNNSAYVDEISVFTKYDKGVIPYGINYPDISIGGLTIADETFTMQNDTGDFIGDPNWVYDRKKLNVNKFLPLNTKVSSMAQLMLDATPNPLKIVNISTNLTV